MSCRAAALRPLRLGARRRCGVGATPIASTPQAPAAPRAAAPRAAAATAAPRAPGARAAAAPTPPPHRRRAARLRARGMYVPSDGFGGVSPEQKAADHLKALFTFIAARVVLSQLEGSGRGALGAYDAAGHAALSGALADGGGAAISRDAEQWLARLLESDPAIGRRVLEVRAAYAEGEFEWGNAKRLALDGVRGANLRLMRRAAGASLRAAAAGGGGGGDESGGGGGGSSGSASSGGGGGGE